MVYAYVYDVIWITKNGFKGNINTLEEVIQRLVEAVLKVNAESLFFGII